MNWAPSIIPSALDWLNLATTRFGTCPKVPIIFAFFLRGITTWASSTIPPPLFNCIHGACFRTGTLSDSGISWHRLAASLALNSCCVSISRSDLLREGILPQFVGFDLSCQKSDGTEDHEGELQDLGTSKHLLYLFFI